MHLILSSSLPTSLKRGLNTKIQSLQTSNSEDNSTHSSWGEGQAATPSRAHSTDKLGRGPETVPAARGARRKAES